MKTSLQISCQSSVVKVEHFTHNQETTNTAGWWRTENDTNCIPRQRIKKLHEDDDIQQKTNEFRQTDRQTNTNKQTVENLAGIKGGETKVARGALAPPIFNNRLTDQKKIDYLNTRSKIKKNISFAVLRQSRIISSKWVNLVEFWVPKNFAQCKWL